jgi:predicted MFS family arabinose efflux permease
MGGVVAPALGGKLADHFGLSAVFWMAGCLAALAFLIASQLRERPVAPNVKRVEQSLAG